MSTRAANEETKPTDPPRSGGKRGLFLALAAVGLLLIGLFVALLSRNLIAASLISSGLEERGMRCGELEVDLAIGMGSAEIGPMRCTLEEGAIAAIDVRSPTHADLSGLSPSALLVGEIELTLRPGQEDSSRVRWLPGATEQIARDKVVGMVRGLRELALRRVPPTRVRRAVVRRGQSEVATVESLGIGRDAERISLEIRSVELARQDSLVGSTSVRLESVTGHAGPLAVDLAGVVVSEARVMLLGSVGARRSSFRLEARELQTASPIYQLQTTL